MANKLRSSLTMLGMVIGVGAVITLMSIGQGAQAAVQAQFNRLGTNLVYVDPGTTNQNGVKQPPGLVQTLTNDDAKALADSEVVPDALLVAPEGSTPGQIVYQSNNTVGRIKGVTTEYSPLHNYNVARGSWFTDDQMQGAFVVVLGPTIAQSLFGDVDPIGLRMRLNTGGGRTGSFQVIGISEAKGGAGFDNPDNTVYIPLNTFFRTLYHLRNAAGVPTVTHISLKASDDKHIAAVEQEITDAMRLRHHITDTSGANDDFSVTSQQDQIQTRAQITGVLTIFLGAVAGISLVVGGIGIMNIMIVSVTERTREIGIRKAVGARRQDILLQFLVEAMLVSILGGIGGIGAGIGISRFVDGYQLNGQALQTLVSTQSIVLAGGVSAAIGLFFGIYPASRAARLNPIQALRYE